MIYWECLQTRKLEEKYSFQFENKVNLELTNVWFQCCSQLSFAESTNKLVGECNEKAVKGRKKSLGKRLMQELSSVGKYYNVLRMQL